MYRRPIPQKPKRVSALQKSNLIILIEQQDFDRRDFVWKSENSHSSDKPDLMIEVLYHKNGQYYFTFDHHGVKGTWSERNPGEHTSPDDDSYNNEDAMYLFFDEWLKLVKQNLEVEDIVDDWMKGADLYGQIVKVDLENDRFTEEEKQTVFSKLSDIEARLISAVQQQSASVEEIQRSTEFIKQEVQYLRDGADRLGKKDWKNIAISTIMNIVTSVMLSNEAGQRLANGMNAVILFLAQNMPA
jgi:hypothetical protein